MKEKKQKPTVETEFQLINDLVAANVLTQMALRREETEESTTANHKSDSGSQEVIAEPISDVLPIAKNPFSFYFKLARQLRELLTLTNKSDKHA
jgi:hypothetical protein